MGVGAGARASRALVAMCFVLVLALAPVAATGGEFKDRGAP
jgi:hypothetical protein